MTFKNKDWNIEVLLLLSSFFIYYLYFHSIFLNINSALSSITGDALKNYYTYAYHIINDKGILHFSGMNFPFGEHVIYTDCQPLLTFVLRYLPFTHPYVIGILHTLIFLSFIITPNILYRILKRLDVDQLSAFLVSIGIAVLSPQFQKINGGHHGLAYGCVIPLSFLLLLCVIQNNTKKIILTLYHILLFFLHPYIGFGICLFTILFYLLLAIRKDNHKKLLYFSKIIFLNGLLPPMFFKVFMKLSDLHPNRTSEPYGNNALVENLDTLLAPDFGPFKTLMESVFKNKITHFEGHSYLGFFTIVMSLLVVFMSVRWLRNLQLKKEIFAALLAAFILLLVSFGLHIKVLNLLHIQSASLNQFRANCRFAWHFYFILPLFIFTFLNQNKTKLIANNFRLIPILASLFLVFQLIEGHYFFERDKQYFWHFKNVFKYEALSSEEKQIVQQLKISKAQAILPLPLFHVGSEMYDRIGSDLSMLPSMIYSFHTGVPIISSWMSRTSMTETREVLQLMNAKKKNKLAFNKMNGQPIFIIKTNDNLLPDEERLDKKVEYFLKNGSLQFGLIKSEVLNSQIVTKSALLLKRNLFGDTANIVFIKTENRKPYLEAKLEGFETMYVLDSNKVKTGSYILSFRYYYSGKNYKSLAGNVLVTRNDGKEYKWLYYQQLSTLSGFYNNYDVFEFKVDLEKNCRYEFSINGHLGEPFHVSHFLLRPENIDVMLEEEVGSRSLNNFCD